MFHPINAQALSKFNSKASMEFIEILENAIDSNIKDDNISISNKTIAPSSFRCMRRNWFRLIGAEKDEIPTPDRSLEFSAVIGQACHSMIQSLLDGTAFWVPVSQYLNMADVPYDFTCESSGYETKLSLLNPWPIRFACDGILQFPPEIMEDPYCLLEIKSCTSASFKELTDPKEKHIDQVKCYCSLLNLRRVLFVYIDRTYGDMKCYDVHVTEKDVDLVKEKFDKLMWHAKYSVAPDPLPKGDDWCTSNMCPYYKKCKSW